jgi:hypothetical protein
MVDWSLVNVHYCLRSGAPLKRGQENNSDGMDASFLTSVKLEEFDRRVVKDE